MGRCLVFVLAVLVLASTISAYTDRGFTMDVQFKEDGSAHVIEKSLLNLDSDSEIQAFEFVLKEGKTTLADWQKFSRNIRYHTTGSSFNLRIVAAREFPTGFTAASVTLEYDVANLTLLTPVSSRKTVYGVDMEKIALGQPGEVTLGNNMALVMRLPPDALRVAVSPEAGVNVFTDERLIRWVGPASGTWDVSFEREITLGQEVQAFFVEWFRVLSSSFILWVLLAFAAAVVGYKVLGAHR
ncbi:hypothetical protein HY572_01680 [Candidatus Micrarchaeota archaeon]|nr:hypothetical protein [Candidatus Micrarchaeota archaeon]